jgi:hypothetical protein
MKRFNFVIAAALTATLVLTACDITITPGGPPTPDVTRSAGTNPGAAVWSGTVPAGGAVIFKLDVPASVSDNFDVIYLELDSNLQLELRNPNNYNIVATSSGPSFFASGIAGLATVGVDLDAQAIGVATACRGSCIIIPGPSARSFYARVVNNSGTSVATSLYFYGDVEQDTNEQNDSLATATTFDVLSGTGDQGAIELLNDVDFFWMSGPRTVQFSTATGNPVGLRLDLLNAAGVVIGGLNGPGNLNVIGGDYLRVSSVNGRAGAPATSQYTLLGQP